MAFKKFHPGDVLPRSTHPAAKVYDCGPQTSWATLHYFREEAALAAHHYRLAREYRYTHPTLSSMHARDAAQQWQVAQMLRRRWERAVAEEQRLGIVY